MSATTRSFVQCRSWLRAKHRRHSGQLRWFAVLLQPFVPDTAAALLDLLSVPPDRRRMADLDTPLVPGTPLPVPRPIVPRLEEPEAAQ